MYLRGIDRTFDGIREQTGTRCGGERESVREIPAIMEAQVRYIFKVEIQE